MLRAINATINDESNPPLSIAPTGTSLMRRRRTASSRTFSNPSAYSSSDLGDNSTGSGNFEYLSRRNEPFSIINWWPGGNLDTPARGVLGAGKNPRVR